MFELVSITGLVSLLILLITILIWRIDQKELAIICGVFFGMTFNFTLILLYIWATERFPELNPVSQGLNNFVGFMELVFFIILGFILGMAYKADELKTGKDLREMTLDELQIRRSENIAEGKKLSALIVDRLNEENEQPKAELR